MGAAGVVGIAVRVGNGDSGRGQRVRRQWRGRDQLQLDCYEDVLKGKQDARFEVELEVDRKAVSNLYVDLAHK